MIILSGKSGVSGTQFPLIEKIKSVQTVGEGTVIIRSRREEEKKKKKKKRRNWYDTQNVTQLIYVYV